MRRIRRPAILAVGLWLILAAQATATEVRFRYRPTVEAKTVSVAGTFNQWNNAVHWLEGPDADGIWNTTLDLEPGSYQYKFVVNRSDWFTDTFAEAFIDDGFGGKNSVVNVGRDPMIVGEPGETAAEFVGTAVRFSFDSAGRKVNSVSLAGDFNDWDAGAHPMHRDGTIWWIELPLRPGAHRYQFVLDGETWIADPSSAPIATDEFGGGISERIVDGPAPPD